jgi:putrescine transport system substrate-binding protein
MRRFFARLRLPLLCLAALPATFAGAASAEPEVNIFIWSDYLAEDTLPNFQAKTGIKPVMDVYDSNDILEAKLLAGKSGYDVVVPTARPFGARQVKTGIFQPLDKSKLPSLGNIDPQILASIEAIDKGNAHLVPYMWGTTGLGVNEEKVKAALGVDKIPDTWGLVFDPENAKKLKGCGISLMDDATEVFAAALSYLGKDPNSTDQKDLDAAAEQIKKIQPYVRYFHSSQYINDMANGDTCVAHGYSGDIFQARDRADEADKGVKVGYVIPKEGAVLWVDVLAIPKDAPNPDQAHAFIEYLLDPKVIADASNFVHYANPNPKSKEFLDEEVRNDPSVYPNAEVQKRLFVLVERSDKDVRALAIERALFRSVTLNELRTIDRVLGDGGDFSDVSSVDSEDYRA